VNAIFCTHGSPPYAPSRPQGEKIAPPKFFCIQGLEKNPAGFLTLGKLRSFSGGRDG
jgi:hypothetical protein